MGGDMTEDEKAEARYRSVEFSLIAGIEILDRAAKDHEGGDCEWLRRLLNGVDCFPKSCVVLGGFSFLLDYVWEIGEYTSLTGVPIERQEELQRLHGQYLAKFWNFILLVERCYPEYAERVERLRIRLEEFELHARRFLDNMAEDENAGRELELKEWVEIENDFRVLFAGIANSCAASAAGDSLIASVVGEGSRRAKQRPAEVSIYAGKEVPGEGAYIGKRIAVANDGRSITLKNNERASGKRYTYYPRTIPLVDALVNQFANGGGWLEPECLMKKIGKDGKKWQSLIDDKKTLKAAIESEVVNNRPTGRIRLKAAAFE